MSGHHNDVIIVLCAYLHGMAAVLLLDVQKFKPTWWQIFDQIFIKWASA